MTLETKVKSAVLRSLGSLALASSLALSSCTNPEEINEFINKIKKADIIQSHSNGNSHSITPQETDIDWGPNTVEIYVFAKDNCPISKSTHYQSEIDRLNSVYSVNYYKFEKGLFGWHQVTLPPLDEKTKLKALAKYGQK